MRGSLSPLDGRYADVAEPIRESFCERKLVNERVRIELAYLQKLGKTIGLDVSCVDVEATVSPERVFELEKITHHDVKAAELAVREIVPKELTSFVHFGLTSQDINSLAVTRQVRGAVVGHIFPAIRSMITHISAFSDKHKDTVMLSYTHGQPATPTTLGAQFAVFAERLDNVVRSFITYRWTTKFGGATGGFNAHKLVYPDVDWCAFGDSFVADYSNGHIMRQQHTTQIEHYDGLGAVFDCMKRLCVIITDLCSDMWHYIHLGYLKQRPASAHAVGSSAMPHKINPIQFENAEGNMSLAIALFEMFARKLPVSRLQRDLTDSTVTRNIGVAFGYMFVGVTNAMKGLNMIDANLDVITKDLNDHPEVIMEGLQSLLRAEGNIAGYDDLLQFSRQTPNITLDALRSFIRAKYSDSPSLQRMLALTPQNYCPI